MLDIRAKVTVRATVTVRVKVTVVKIRGKNYG